MHRDIDRVLISESQIAARVAELAESITSDHPEEGGQLVMVPIMTGGMIFCSDLIRRIPMPMQIGLLTVTSYPGKSIASQGARVLSQQLEHVRGRRVVVIDDILDSGGTLRLVGGLLRDLQAASVKTCVLLRKERAGAVAAADYVGFDIPDEFVVGYGLDFDNYYRNLPDIVTLKPQAIERARGLAVGSGSAAQ